MTATNRQPEATMTAKLVVAGETHVGRVRDHNEDAFVIAPIGVARNGASRNSTYDLDEAPVLLGVSDGMGGQAAGEVASALVVDGLVRSLVAAEQPGIDALRTAIARAHHDVRAAADLDNERRGMGATLAAALVVKHTAYVVAVGDSRAYLLRAGDLVQLTRDQSLAQMLVDAGQLEPAAAATSPLKHVLASAMGHGDEVGAEVITVALESGDRLVLCSDGLTNEVDDDELARIARGSRSITTICHRLVGAANRHGGHDNVTVIVADIVDKPVGPT